MVITNAPRGTEDILPSQVHKWQYIEEICRGISSLFGFREIRVPTFEHTELFTRSVGDSTDVVQKEMYTFLDKGGRSITLRPEGTASAARAVIQNSLLSKLLPVKLFYILDCFRYEKPQSGRLREFHQFGVEMYGSDSPKADAEVISLADSLLESLGLADVILEINSIGCPECRPIYLKALKDYFEKNTGSFCKTCLDRLGRNPMRILDCKNPACNEVAKSAPEITGFLCEDCNRHFSQVRSLLDLTGVKYRLNPRMVRGLDYYTRTVFEFIIDGIGAQSTVVAGGRYDGLIEELGGQSTPALGFAMGIERIILAMESRGVEFPEQKNCQIYIASIGEPAAHKAIELCKKLRDEGFYAEYDMMDRSVKAQMKYADKISAEYSVVIGDNELENNIVTLKNMITKESYDLELDNFIKSFYDIMLSKAFEEMTDCISNQQLDLNNILNLGDNT